MSIAADPATVRQLVHRVFKAQLTAPTLDVLELDERISIHDGKVVARSYRHDQLFAMWLVDVGLVQFYDGDGALLQSVNVLYSPPTRRAA